MVQISEKDATAKVDDMGNFHTSTLENQPKWSPTIPTVISTSFHNFSFVYHLCYSNYRIITSNDTASPKNTRILDFKEAQKRDKTTTQAVLVLQVTSSEPTTTYMAETQFFI